MMIKLNNYCSDVRKLCSTELQADSALAMLPLPGCEVKMSGERLTFTIKHMERQYLVTVDNEQAQIKWMAVLDLASNAVLREKTNL